MLVAFAFVPGAVLADAGRAIATEGKGGAVACQTCHGPAGEGNAQGGFPRLAGLPAAYLQQQLQDYAQGQRNNPVMMLIAQALSEADRQVMATYYAGLPPPAAAAAAPAASNPVGVQLALRGRWSDGVPACVQCHGPGGRGVGADFPPLAGQPASYIEAQMQAWKAGTRPPGPLDLMRVIAGKLSDADAGHVAQYFAALSPAAPAASAAPAALVKGRKP